MNNRGYAQTTPPVAKDANISSESPVQYQLSQIDQAIERLASCSDAFERKLASVLSPSHPAPPPPDKPPAGSCNSPLATKLCAQKSRIQELCCAMQQILERCELTEEVPF